MALSLRFIFWFPVAICFILNMIFKLWIFILQHIGNASVWINKQIIKSGDYFTDKAKNDDGLDNFLDQLQKTTNKTKAKIKAKRST